MNATSKPVLSAVKTGDQEATRLNTVGEILEDMRQGKMVVIMDDEDRENEGDLIMAANMVRPEDINFMARYGRGLICLSITRERCDQLNLSLMVNDNGAQFATNFTASIEAAEGVTTGISAYDRAHTIRTAVRPNATPRDIVQPGHIFPLMARPGGVLTRAGHTEAAVDLALLAGIEPAAVLVEILNEDGSMARRPELEAFAREHKLKIGTIADLIRYRMETENSIEMLHRRNVKTEHGEFEMHVYQDKIHQCLHWALMKGQPQADEPFLVRVHVQNLLSDVLALDDPGYGLPLSVAMQTIERRGSGLVLVLGQQESDAQRLAMLEQRPQPVDEQGDNAVASELRTYGIGAQIISDLGIRKMQVLSAPKRFHGLAGFGLQVTGYCEPDDT